MTSFNHSQVIAQQFSDDRFVIGQFADMTIHIFPFHQQALSSTDILPTEHFIYVTLVGGSKEN